MPMPKLALLAKLLAYGTVALALAYGLVVVESSLQAVALVAFAIVLIFALSEA